MSRLRSLVGGPLGARLVGAVLAVAGVALLVVGLLTLRGRPTDEGGRPGAAATSSSPSTASAPAGPTTGSGPPSSPPATPTSPPTGSPTASPTAAEPSTPAPPAAARAPLTVLNNSKVSGLGHQVADQARRKGWRVATVGNFAGRIPVTTIYFTPGNAAQERAARQFATEFPEVQRVFPRYEGLPPTPAGIVLVVTRDWLS